MSNYNTQLQSNNTDLQALINKANALPDAVNIDAELTEQDNLISQIQAVVDSLPEAGSSSGGSGGIETYTGTIVANSENSDAYILYTDKNLTLQETDLGFLPAHSITVEVPKNTAIIIDAPGGASADSGCEDLIGNGCSYHITANNFIITVY